MLAVHSFQLNFLVEQYCYQSALKSYLLAYFFVEIEWFLQDGMWSTC